MRQRSGGPQGGRGRRAHNNILRPHGLRRGQDIHTQGDIPRHGDQQAYRISARQVASTRDSEDADTDTADGRDMPSGSLSRIVTELK